MNSSYEKLCEQLTLRSGHLYIALSGGIDSLTLMAVAAKVRPQPDTTAIHAVSAAVPAEATERCRELAQQYGWQLREVDAREMENADYVNNPVNRCYFCKSSLFNAIDSVSQSVGLFTTATGTNTDDLGDYRPGLAAATERNVWQPFVEVGINKKIIRKIATFIGLGALADIPAQPCLASRVETGISIDVADLRFIHRVEKAMTALTEPGDIRCRLKSQGVMVQLPSDNKILQSTATEQRAVLIMKDLCESQQKKFIGFERYQMGSSFLVNRV